MLATAIILKENRNISQGKSDKAVIRVVLSTPLIIKLWWESSQYLVLGELQKIKKEESENLSRRLLLDTPITAYHKNKSLEKLKRSKMFYLLF